MSIAGELAKFVTDTSVDDLPPLALERARLAIASTIASAAMGASIVWFDGGALPVAGAARVNAVMSDAAASDDSDLRSIAHIGTIVSTTAIAMAEHTGASGRDVLAAVVLGYEIAGRPDEALTPGRPGIGTYRRPMARGVSRRRAEIQPAGARQTSPFGPCG